MLAGTSLAIWQKSASKFVAGNQRMRILDKSSSTAKRNFAMKFKPPNNDKKDGEGKSGLPDSSTYFEKIMNSFRMIPAQ